MSHTVNRLQAVVCPPLPWASPDSSLFLFSLSCGTFYFLFTLQSTWHCLNIRKYLWTNCQQLLNVI